MIKNPIRAAGAPMHLLLATLALAFYLIALPLAMKREASAPSIDSGEPTSAMPASSPVAKKNSMSEIAEPSLPMFAPMITATKVDALAVDVDGDTKADPGDTLMYTVTITNGGPDAAMGVMFNDTIDANTTLIPSSVNTSPLAFNDTYSAIGNVQISIAAPGLLTNDTDADGNSLTITGNTTPAAGGNLTVSANGAFTYNPPPGFEGSATFTYTISDGQTPPKTDTGTVTITVNGMIWFIDDDAAAGGDGRLTNPFNALTGAGSFDATAVDDPGDNIFLFSGNYTGGLTLLDNQRLIGQGASDTLANITGLTPPTGSLALPTTGGASPVITSSANGVNLGMNNTIRGLTIGNTTGSDISGTSFGTLTVGPVSLPSDTTLNGTGRALNLTTGTLAARFAALDSTNSSATGITLSSVGGNLASSGTNIQNPTGAGISISGSSAGGTFNFANTTVNGSGGTGVSLTDNAGSVTFADLDITPDSNQRGLHASYNAASGGGITTTSGTISATNAIAVEINKASGSLSINVALTSVSSSNAANGILLMNTSGSFLVNGDGSNTSVGGNSTGGTISNMSGADNAVAGNGVYLSGAANVTLRRMTINGTNQNNGISGNNSSNFTLEYSTVNGTNGNNGAGGIEESSVNFNNWTGTGVITNCLIEGGRSDNLRVVNTGGTLNRLTVTGCTFGFNQNAVDGNNSIHLESLNAGTALNYTLQSSTIKGARSDWLNAQPSSGGTMDGIIGGNSPALGNNFDNTGANMHPGAIANGNRILLQANGTYTVDVSNNTVKGSLGSAIATNSATGAAVMTININDNSIGVAGTANSGSSAASGISIQSTGGGDVTVSIEGNTIRQYNNHGILFTLGDQMGNVANISATVSNNSVNTPGTINDNFNGFHINSGTVMTDNFTACFNIFDNNFTGGGKGSVSPNNSDVRLRQRQGTTVQLPGYTGPARDNTDSDVAEVITYLRPAGSGGVKNNTFGTGNANSVSTGGGYTNSGGGAACSTPPPPGALPEEFARADSRGEAKEQVYRDILFAPEIGSGNKVVPLRQADLSYIVRAALARWREMVVDGEDYARLEAVEFEIADLPDDQLVLTTPTKIIIDETAAGYGWFIDATPEEDSEFKQDAAKLLRAGKSSQAFEQMDLSTAVARGLNYVLEHEWFSRSLNRLALAESVLRPSERRLPIGPVHHPVPLPAYVEVVTNPPAEERLEAQMTRVEATPENAALNRSETRAASSNPNLRPSVVRVSSATGRFGARARYAALSRYSPMSGESITKNIGTLPAGKSVTIMFNVTIDNPLPNGVCTVSNQGTVSGSNFSNVLTDDPSVGGASNPTVTDIFIPPTISCPSNITTNTDAGQCTAVVNFSTTTTGCPVPTVVCAPIASGGAFPKGTTTVTCTATNSEGSANCMFTVTVNDNENPTITCPANVTIGTDTGLCSAVVNYTVPTATDNCPGATVACSPNTGTAFPKGTTTVTCTTTDAGGLTAQCSFTVTVNDDDPPTIGACPSDITTNTDSGLCTAVVSYTAPTGSDNCPGVTVACAPASGTAFNKGTTTVTCTATDGAGLTATCTFTVTVNDNQNPTLGACPSNITTNTEAGVCTATVTFTPPTVSDNCPGATVACAPASGATFNLGTTTVTCTGTDAMGLTAQCTFTVTVNDNQNPTVSCPANVTQNTDAGLCTSIVNYTVPTASDNCPGPTVACSPNTGTAFPKGTTTVTCTATDGSGNTGNCTFTVTVNDNQNPTLTGCPSNITTPAASGQCSETVSYTPPTASDNCPGVGAVVCAPASGTAFNVGTTTVTCSVSDAMSNTAMCSFTVTVTDNQNPSISCPANINVSTGAGCATVTFTTPTPTDNCPGATAVCAPPSGTCFAIGATTVTCTATDASSNMSSCMFTVTVVPCTITCPSNVTTNNDAGVCGANVTYSAPTTTGSCGTVTCAPSSGSLFAVGTTTVTCSTSAGPSCTFTVTVNDTENPTVNCPANITQGTDTGVCTAIVNYTVPTASDNCPGPTVACSPNTGTAFPKGTTTVTCTATDAASNTANCTFTVTVVDDDAPSITCPANVTTGTDVGLCSAAVSYAAPTVSDNCPGVGSPVCSPASGATFAKGVTTVNCTVMDAAGNSSNCSFTVTVNDTQPPVAVCPANIVKGTDAGLCSAVVMYTASATDNCPGASVVCAPVSGSAFPKGTTTVSCTATDASNNMSVCMFTVTVNDTQSPTISCPPAQVVPPGVVNYPAPTTTDNCPGESAVCNPPSGSTFPAGITTVTCTATDAAGNTASCSFVVTTFDVCIQDDGGGGKLLINTKTGDYMFCCGGMIVSGKGTVKKKGCIITLTHSPIDRRVSVTYDTCLKKGQGVVQMPPGTVKCTITDSNTRDSVVAPCSPAPRP
jgi:uncharacterized repeat protein (TIGR01451 family)